MLACEAIVAYLSAPEHTKKKLLVIWNIAKKISQKIQGQDPLLFQKTFVLATGSYPFQLKFYKLLNLPANIEILAPLVHKLVQSKSFKESKIPKFDFTNNQINPLDLGEFSAAAIYLLRPAPIQTLLQNFIGIYLNDKAIKPSLRDFMVLYKPMLAQITTQQFAEELLSIIKRIIIRAVALLPEVSLLISYLSCDLSPFVWEIISPNVLEYLYNEKYFSDALGLFKALTKRALDLTDFSNKMIAVRDINESQTVTALSALSQIPASQLPNKEPLISYTIAMGNRVKKESFKKIVADCLSNLNPDPTPQIIDYLRSNIQNAAFANLLHSLIKKHELKVDIQYPSPSSSLQYAISLSIKFPDPCPNATAHFLNEKSSGLYLLQNLPADESLAIARCIRNGLEIFTDSEPLINKFALLSVSKFGLVRKFCYENWPIKSPVFMIVRGLIEATKDDDLLSNFANHFKVIIHKIMNNIKTAEDSYSVCELLNTENGYSLKRISFVSQKYSQNFLPFDPTNCFKNKNVSGFILAIGNFEDILDYAGAQINYGIFKSQIEKKEFIERGWDDPHFNDVPRLIQICEETLQKASIKGDPRNRPLLDKAFEIVWQKLIEKVEMILNGVSEGIKLRKYKQNPAFYDRMYRQIIPTIYHLYQIHELNGPVWNFVYNLMSHSKSFQRIASQFTIAFLRSSLGIWSDRALINVFQFVERNITISELDLNEAYLLEKLVIWVLRQPGTSLRSSALNMMIEFLYAKNYFSLDDSIDQICNLLQTYSSPLLNSLFPPLIPILKPCQWEPFFNILLLLEPMTKTVLLDYLLQYEDIVPNEKWAVSSIYLSLFDEVEAVTSCSQEIWDKFKFNLTLEIFLNNILVHIYHENVEIQSMAAKASAHALKSNED